MGSYERTRKKTKSSTAAQKPLSYRTTFPIISGILRVGERITRIISISPPLVGSILQFPFQQEIALRQEPVTKTLLTHIERCKEFTVTISPEYLEKAQILPIPKNQYHNISAVTIDGHVESLVTHLQLIACK